jgi:Ion channel
MTEAAPELTGQWHLGSRVARLHESHSYGFVLLLVLASFAFAAAASDDAWTGSVLLLLEAATLVTALWTSGVARTNSRMSRTLVIVAAAVAAANLVWGGTDLAEATGLLAATLVIATAGSIGIGVADQRDVNARSVLGAVSIYLLLGMLFVFVYGAVAALGSGPFFAQGTDGTRPLRLYFSYVTLATLGYGDYTPAGNFGHMLAVLEALTGQLYLVTIVALLVSRLRPRRSGS